MKHLPALFFVLAIASSSILSAQTALRAAFVDGADVLFFFDPQAMNNSGFSKAVEADQTPEEKAEAEKQMAFFKEATGLEEEDLTALVFAMDIDGIDFESEDPAQLENAKAVMAAELKTSITLEQVQAALETLAAENEGPVPSMEISEMDGMQVLKLTGAESPGGVDQAFATLSEDGKTALLAFNTMSLKDGLARLDGGAPAAPTADMEVATKALGSQQLRMALVLPANARQMIQQNLQGAAAQGGMGAMFMPFAGMKSLLVGANATDSLDVSLSMDLGDPGNAQQAAGMVQSFLPMMMMGMQQQLGPEAMTLAQKIKIVPEGGVVSIRLNLTPEDIRMLPSPGAGGDMPGTPMMEME